MNSNLLTSETEKRHQHISGSCKVWRFSWCMMELFVLEAKYRRSLCPHMTQRTVSDASFTLFVLLTTGAFMRLRDFCDTLTWTKFREHRMCNLQLILSLWERRDQTIGLLWPREVKGARTQTAGWRSYSGTGKRSFAGELGVSQRGIDDTQHSKFIMLPLLSLVYIQHRYTAYHSAPHSLTALLIMCPWNGWILN